MHQCAREGDKSCSPRRAHDVETLLWLLPRPFPARISRTVETRILGMPQGAHVSKPVVRLGWSFQRCEQCVQHRTDWKVDGSGVFVNVALSPLANKVCTPCVHARWHINPHQHFRDTLACLRTMDRALIMHILDRTTSIHHPNFHHPAWIRAS